MRKTKIENFRRAGRDHAVVTVKTTGSDRHHHRNAPCEECPWRRDAKIGAFPADAYRHSAPCGYDTHIGQPTFACHMSGSAKPQTCAGFLLSYNADHNFSVRVSESQGRIDRSKIEQGTPTYRTYKEMAVANGVPPDDPALRKCRVP
jgi:hypothetical protein